MLGGDSGNTHPGDVRQTDLTLRRQVQPQESGGTTTSLWGEAGTFSTLHMQRRQAERQFAYKALGTHPWDMADGPWPALAADKAEGLRPTRSSACPLRPGILRGPFHLIRGAGQLQLTCPGINPDETYKATRATRCVHPGGCARERLRTSWKNRAPLTAPGSRRDIGTCRLGELSVSREGLQHCLLYTSDAADE